jgi:hypothetical protein
MQALPAASGTVSFQIMSDTPLSALSASRETTSDQMTRIVDNFHAEPAPNDHLLLRPLPAQTYSAAIQSAVSAGSKGS